MDYCLSFPDEEEKFFTIQFGSFHIGEIIFWVGKEGAWIIDSIEHQFIEKDGWSSYQLCILNLRERK